MGSAFHLLCLRYSEILTPAATTAIRKPLFFTFYGKGSGGTAVNAPELPKIKSLSPISLKIMSSVSQLPAKRSFSPGSLKPLGGPFKYVCQLILTFNFAAEKDFLLHHGGESQYWNGRVHGILCRYSDKTSKQTSHTFLHTQPIFIKQSAHTSLLFEANVRLQVTPQ